MWLSHRFCLSFRDVEELLANRGVTVSYEAVRQWCLQFGPSFAKSSGIAEGDSGTPGTSTRSLSGFRSAYCGGSGSRVTYCDFSFNRTGISVRANASFASC